MDERSVEYGCLLIDTHRTRWSNVYSRHAGNLAKNFHTYLKCTKTMSIKIVIYGQIGGEEETIRAIQSVAPDATVVKATQETLAADLADAEIFYGFHTPEVFRDAKRLRWIQAQAAGLDRMLEAELVERGLIITNASGVHAPQVAEAAWALTLAISRGMPTYFRQQQEHVWKWTTLQDLDGATAGIIGLGGIGRRYARIAAAVGMRVIAVDLHATTKPEEVESLWPMERIESMLAASDVVLVSCPYTPETRRLINSERLWQMKSSAILVNISRGGIVDEQALCEVLQNGHLRGAGLDVTETEPLPADSPLWDTPRLVITPHCAGISPGRNRRLTEFFCENLRRYLAGESLANVIDQKRGYPVPSA
ncbi:MAG: phosphoglycerate dehydrogenase [Planctomycetaceae bacterium]|nr:phosphoglycerate dehydrogenase [Planctomycetaceae bacterium]